MPAFSTASILRASCCKYIYVVIQLSVHFFLSLDRLLSIFFVEVRSRKISRTRPMQRAAVLTYWCDGR